MLDSSLSKDQKLYLFSNNFKENIQELFLKTLVKVKYKPIKPLDGSPFSKNINLLLILFWTCGLYNCYYNQRYYNYSILIIF